MDFDYSSLGAGYYDEILGEKKGMRRFWHEYRFKELESFIDSDPASRILDVGCAAGSFLGRLHKPFKEAVGVDISTLQVKYANEKYGDERRVFRVGDIRRLDFSGNRFDYVVLSEVIEHVSYAEASSVLKTLRTLMADKGKLVVTTPNYLSLWPVVEFCVNRMIPVSYEHQHINKLDCHKLNVLISDAGFKIQDLRTFFFIGPFLSFMSFPLAERVCAWEKRFFPKFGSLIIASASVC